MPALTPVSSPSQLNHPSSSENTSPLLTQAAAVSNCVETYFASNQINNVDWTALDAFFNQEVQPITQPVTPENMHLSGNSATSSLLPVNLDVYFASLATPDAHAHDSLLEGVSSLLDQQPVPMEICSDTES